jgi:hypothetical protein
MDLLFLTTIVTAGIAAFGLAAVRWGADTRPGVSDDHRR